MAANSALPSSTNDDCITAIVIGCGARGKIYSRYEGIRVVGAVDTSATKLNLFSQIHDIDEAKQWHDWKDALGDNAPKYAQVAIITTPDVCHAAPAIAAIEKGYHVLLEKPMATSLEECRKIAEAAEKYETMVAVCHVLKYTPANMRIRSMIANGDIGDVLSITHTEPVGYQHFAHSFVRGQWSQEQKSTFSLMAKSCHDIDLILSFMGDDGGENCRDMCTSVTSFGGLKHFKKENKPTIAGDSLRCHECPAASKCPYDSMRLYVKDGKPTNWAKAIVDDIPDIENVTEALKVGPFGVCAYEHENDVADHQQVLLEFKSGATAAFSMVATTERLCERETKVYGSKGELSSDDVMTVRHKDFVSGKVVIHKADEGLLKGEALSGHGYADLFCVSSFVDAIKKNDKSLILTDAHTSLRSHLVVYASEAARRQRRVVDVDEGGWPSVGTKGMQ